MSIAWLCCGLVSLGCWLEGAEVSIGYKYWCVLLFCSLTISSHIFPITETRNNSDYHILQESY